MSSGARNQPPVVAEGVVSLSARLREATRAEHERAEHRPFIERLMGGELALGDYTRYLAQLSYVYEALEARAPQPGDPQLVHDERLHRTASIAADLVALGVADRDAEHPALDATRSYVDRIEAARDPLAFLAHHYTRYLGDLSGGQAIAAMMARHYGATPDQLGFARFDRIDKPVVFKRAYRDALDGLDLAPERAELLVAETRAAYVANSALFDALAGH